MAVTIPNAGIGLAEDANVLDFFTLEPYPNVAEMERKLIRQSNSRDNTLCDIVEGLMEIFFRSYRETDLTQTLLMASGAHLFRGSHVRIYGDNGVVFALIQGAPGLHRNNRESSHVSIGPQRQVLGNTAYGGQFELVFPGDFGSILFGVAAYNGQPAHTWFQAEATSGDGYVNIAWHTVVDFTLHKLSGKQVGQLGYSEHTEKQNKALIYQGQLPANLLYGLSSA
ncbi:MAG: hypothetical protein ACREFP_07190 [Acetobacteraceae bacterium]